MVKTLIVYAVAAFFLIPALMEIYNKAMNNGESVLDAEYDTVNLGGKESTTPEDLARRA